MMSWFNNTVTNCIITFVAQPMNVECSPMTKNLRRQVCGRILAKTRYTSPIFKRWLRPDLLLDCAYSLSILTALIHRLILIDCHAWHEFWLSFWDRNGQGWIRVNLKGPDLKMFEGLTNFYFLVGTIGKLVYFIWDTFSLRSKLQKNKLFTQCQTSINKTKCKIDDVMIKKREMLNYFYLT